MYVVRLPYEKFDDPTNPSLKYLESLTVPQDGTPQEKAKIQALKNIAKEFTTGGMYVIASHRPFAITVSFTSAVMLCA